MCEHFEKIHQTVTMAFYAPYTLCLQGKWGPTKVNTWWRDLAAAVAAWLAAINKAAGHILQPGTYQCCWEVQGHTD